MTERFLVCTDSLLWLEDTRFEFDCQVPGGKRQRRAAQPETGNIRADEIWCVSYAIIRYLVSFAPLYLICSKIADYMSVRPKKILNLVENCCLIH